VSAVTKRSVTTTRHEYAVPSPATAADMQQAIDLAMQEMPPERRRYDDAYTVEARFGEIVVWWPAPAGGEETTP